MADQQQQQSQQGGAGKFLQDVLKDDKDLQNTVMGWLANLNLNIGGFNLGDFLKKIFAKSMGQDDASAEAAAADNGGSDNNVHTDEREEFAVINLKKLFTATNDPRISELIQGLESGEKNLTDVYDRFGSTLHEPTLESAEQLSAAVNNAFASSAGNPSALAAELVNLGAAAQSLTQTAEQPALEIQGNFNESSEPLGLIAEGVNAAGFAEIQKIYDDPSVYIDFEIKPRLENFEAARLDYARNALVQAMPVNGFTQTILEQMMIMDEEQFMAQYNATKDSAGEDFTIPDAANPALILAMGRNEFYTMNAEIASQNTTIDPATIPAELVSHVSALLTENNIEDPDGSIARAFAGSAIEDTAVLDAVYDPSTGEVGLVANLPNGS